VADTEPVAEMDPIDVALEDLGIRIEFLGEGMPRSILPAGSRRRIYLYWLAGLGDAPVALPAGFRDA